MKTTLNQIKANHPCAEGYSKLLKFLGKTKADDEPLALSTILESNGFLDTIWCFRTVSGYEKELRLFAVFCARQVQHLLTDPRSIAAIDVSERYANGQATDEELSDACAASDAASDADDAAHAACDAAYYAANAAAYAAATYAAYSAYSAADSAAAYAAYSTAAYAASNAANAVNAAEIKPVLEAYLKNLLLEK